MVDARLLAGVDWLLPQPKGRPSSRVQAALTHYRGLMAKPDSLRNYRKHAPMLDYLIKAMESKELAQYYVGVRKEREGKASPSSGGAQESAVA